MPSKTKVKFRTPEQVYKLWLKALRSGEYKQTAGRLKDGKGFCCLGVLCDLAIKDGGNMTWGGGEYNISSLINSGLEFSAIPPEQILKYIGIKRITAGELADLNDYGTSFKDIAKHIKTDIMPRALAATKFGATI